MSYHGAPGIQQKTQNKRTSPSYNYRRHTISCTPK